MKRHFLSLAASILFLTTNGQSLTDSLYTAVLHDDLASTLSLIRRGADLNAVMSPDPWMKVNSLITAVNKNYYEMTRLLINKGAAINWQDNFGRTALMYAALKGNREMVKLLIEHGADVKASDGKGYTVLSSAQEGKNQDVINYILEKMKEN